MVVRLGVGLAKFLAGALLSILVFRERIGTWKLAGMLLIAGGVVLLSAGL